MRCSGLCPRKPRGLVRAFSGALGLKHVICGCCRVTSQKRLSSRLQALSSFSLLLCLLSFEFDWMVGLVGVEARVQVKARAGRENGRYSRDVQEPRHVRERVQERVQESDLQLARCFSTVQLAPPHGRLVESDRPYGAEPRPCPGLLGGPTVL